MKTNGNSDLSLQFSHGIFFFFGVTPELHICGLCEI